MKNSIVFLICTLSIALVSCSDSDESSSVTLSVLPTDTMALSGLQASVFDSAFYQPKEVAQTVVNSNYVKDAFTFSNKVIKLLETTVNVVVNTRLSILDSIFTKEMGVQHDGSRKWRLETYCFKYKSISVLGDSIYLSGRVSFPNDTARGTEHQVNTLSIYSHQWISSNSGTPSNAVTPLILRSFYNSAVIEPDYEGFGVSADRYHCGASYMVLAQQAVDCTMAALDIMHQHGVALASNGYSTGWGYSLGAPFTLAITKYLETQATETQRNAIRLKSVYFGGGPYLIDKIFKYVDENGITGQVVTNQMIRYLGTLPKSKFEGYNFTDFLPKWMLTYQQTIKGKEYSIIDAWLKGIQDNDSLPKDYNYEDLRDLFAEDMYMADKHLDYTNPKVQLVMKLFHELSDWENWTPQTSIYFTHGTGDKSIPYPIAKECYELLRSRSSNVYWKDTPDTGLSQLLGNAHNAATVTAILNMICVNDPKDVYDLYQ